MHHFKRHRGVTLIELTIAIAIFSVVMLIALDSFLGVLKFNREAVQKQSIQDHTEFLFSLMGREIRMARVNYGDYAGSASCDAYFDATNKVPLNDTYQISADHKELFFQNYEGLCVHYFLLTESFDNYTGLRVARYNPQTSMVWDFNPGDERVDWVLPRDITVTGLYFDKQNMFDLHPVGPTRPPAVKYSITLRSVIWNPSEIKIFNVIAGRNFEQF
jgi:prepilin-type N-terminal cleavage/methylation domain-containing protein